MKQTDGQYHISSQNHRKVRIERDLKDYHFTSKAIKTKRVRSLIKIKPGMIQVVVPRLIIMFPELEDQFLG